MTRWIVLVWHILTDLVFAAGAEEALCAATSTSGPNGLSASRLMFCSAVVRKGACLTAAEACDETDLTKKHHLSGMTAE